MAVIKDKQIQLCICGREKKTDIRSAKRRVSSWLGTAAATGFLIVLITYPSMLVEDIDFKSIIALGLIAYYTVGTIYKTITYIKKKHTPLCALRHAYLDTV